MSGSKQVVATTPYEGAVDVLSFDHLESNGMEYSWVADRLSGESVRCWSVPPPPDLSADPGSIRHEMLYAMGSTTSVVFPVFAVGELSVPLAVDIEPAEDTLKGLTAEERGRCERDGVVPLIRTARDLVAEFFLNVDDIDVCYEKDPEEDHSWYALSVTVKGERRDIRKAAKMYRNMWLSHVSWPESRNVRLLLNICQDR